jgi:hypothetical protein
LWIIASSIIFFRAGTFPEQENGFYDRIISHPGHATGIKKAASDTVFTRYMFDNRQTRSVNTVSVRMNPQNIYEP